jgi:ABC-2 type transport system ATP-binding protein
MSGEVFVAKGITKKFGKTRALDNLTMRLEPGVVTVLLGPNGSGKTTLMRMALGTLKPNAGTLHVMGMDPLKQPKEVRQSVGYVPTIPDVYGWMTLKELFRFLRPQYPTWNDDYANEIIDLLSVPRDTKFKAMSRGQGMKAMLVAALAPEPELLLLDEPFSGLDPLAREEVLRGVLSQIRMEGRTIFCATHDLDVAARLADRVAVIARGRLRKEGTLDEVLGSEMPARIPERILDLVREVVETEEVMI